MPKSTILHCSNPKLHGAGYADGGYVVDRMSNIDRRYPVHSDSDPPISYVNPMGIKYDMGALRVAPLGEDEKSQFSKINPPKKRSM